MPAPVYITGQAGTGKTTKLLERTTVFARDLLTEPHQQFLAMAYMHGARRRLESSISEHRECSKFPRTVCTIDSFALLLVNRWRSALGFDKPVVSAPAQCTDRFERHGRIHLPFDEIARFATNLLASPTVSKITSRSYPLIVIDEFQDCVGSKLDFVRTLGHASQLLLAADDFQFLDIVGDGCPAVRWLDGLNDKGLLHEHHRLIEPWRFSQNPKILHAARALREQSCLAEQAIPVLYGTAAPAAWTILERLRLGWNGPCWTGTTALIAPSGGGVVQDVLRSISEQTTKRGCKPIHWARHTSSDEEQAALRLALGVTNDYLDDNEWQKKEDPLNPHVAEVIDRVQRFAQLRGLDRIPKHLVASISDQLVHARRAYGSNSTRHVVTTIHGAKNCEFDNVCVIWSYKIPANAELQRRLLYNAVTRAKTNCLLFDFRSRNDCTTDSVIVLLGKPKPMFDQKKKRANNSKGQRNKKK